MTAEITYINGSIPVPEALRNIADAIDAGEYEGDHAVLLMDGSIFGLGMADDAQKAVDVVFDLNLALHRLMKAAANG